MKLFCICGNCQKKITISNKASTRQVLARQIGGNVFKITCGNCKVTTKGDVAIVRAESSYKYAQAPSVVGGIVAGGAFGPLGSIIGGIVGGVGATGVKNSDKTETNLFNNS